MVAQLTHNGSWKRVSCTPRVTNSHGPFDCQTHVLPWWKIRDLVFHLGSCCRPAVLHINHYHLERHSERRFVVIVILHINRQCTSKASANVLYMLLSYPTLPAFGGDEPATFCLLAGTCIPLYMKVHMFSSFSRFTGNALPRQARMCKIHEQPCTQKFIAGYF